MNPGIPKRDSCQRCRIHHLVARFPVLCIANRPQKDRFHTAAALPDFRHPKRIGTLAHRSRKRGFGPGAARKGSAVYDSDGVTQHIKTRRCDHMCRQGFWYTRDRSAPAEAAVPGAQDLSCNADLLCQKEAHYRRRCRCTHCRFLMLSGRWRCAAAAASAAPRLHRSGD